ncbi:hypothetical protein TNCV_4656671 [Trichonephila clavipes]|nr:hypothetical protein TNCV_4656671 [Trichonephila clavipes]
MQTYKLDPCWYFTTPALSWDAMLLHTKVTIELFTDYDMLLFIEKGVRGAVEKNNSTRPLSSKIKANAGEKQLNSSVGTKQLNSTGENNSTRQHERNNSTGENNSTQQQERTTQLSSMNETTQLASRNETTQLVSRNETTQLCTSVDRLQPPTTACNRLHRLYSRIGFFYLLTCKFKKTYIHKLDSVAIEVSSRPKLTGIVRGFTCFAQTSDRLPRLTQTYPIIPNVMDMIASNID